MKRVILVAMLDSVHTVRWLRNWKDGDEVEITLVPSGPHRRIHPELLLLMQPQGPLREIRGTSIFGGLISFALDKYLGSGFQLRHLQKATSAIGASTYYLHYLETQHSGYLALKHLREQKPAAVIGSNWGSDLYWFGRFKNHRKKIMKLLEITDRYLVECERDYELAERFGFRGAKTVVGPNSFSNDARLESQKENLIVVKGYQGWAGRAHSVLRACVRAKSHLKDFEIVVFSASFRTRFYCTYLRKRYGLKIHAYRKHHFDREQMLSLFARSIIYVGASRTDGVSTSALEAMSQGAFPIQTNTSCIGNFIVHGVTGLTPGPSEDELENAIIRALEIVKDNKDFIQANESILRSYASKTVARRRFAFSYDL